MSTTKRNALDSFSGLKADSYAASTRIAKKNPGRPVYSDAGDGWVCESVFCPVRKRVCRVSISPSGERVV